MPIQDTDNLIVGRGSDTFKIEYGQIKSDITSGASDYVKLDDGGTEQTIVGGGGLAVASNVTVGNWDGNRGTRTFPSGAFYVRNNNGAPTAVYKVYKDDTNNAKIEFLNDGSATFADGKVEVTTHPRILVNDSGRDLKIQIGEGGWVPGEPAAFQITDDAGDNKATIGIKGSAKFASDKVEINSNGSVISKPTAGSALYAYNGGTSSTNAIVISNTNDGSGIKTELAYDGSATFASATAVSSSGAKNFINGDGFYQIATDGSTNTAYILNDGSATFNGVVDTKTAFTINHPGGTSGTTASTINYVGGSASYALYANGDVKIGGDAGANPNILLQNTGKITAKSFDLESLDPLQP